MSVNGEPGSAVVLPDSFLTLHYRLYDDFGNEYLSTFGLSPATLQLGCRQLAKTLEHCLIGLRSGERRYFEFGPGDAFGHYNPQLVEPISRDALPAEIELQGNSLVEFSGPGDNAKFAGLLRELTKTTATMTSTIRSQARQSPLKSRSLEYCKAIMEIILANPRGFCAGVERAIAIVERAIEKFGAPIYVRHEVVHNKYVCDSLRQKGAVFIDDLAAVPSGSTIIFSAHGVSKAVREEAIARGLKIFDATCPLVTKVHVEVGKMSKEGREIIMIGHKGHPEVAGTMGQSPENMYLVETVTNAEQLKVKNPTQLSYVTQTTLSTNDAEKVVFALKQRFPAIIGPKKDDICYATQNRQDAIKELAGKVDLVLVVGSPTSSNSNRLREVAELLGTQAYLVDRADQIDTVWLEGINRVGVTAGASAPEVLVKDVVAWLCARQPCLVNQLHGVEENVKFALPKELRT